ncbi:MAG: hypothetical protein AYK18_12720 [Theionarchaea archaeon DG-70]|nr:MAG: hypothetical protein AYK18_12720 [Theionarchaea archaeon DG-70]
MPKDDKFLREFFVECEKAMQWRSETETKLLNIFMILNPIIVTAILGINELVSDKRIFLCLTLLMAAFLILITMLLTSIIKAEHKAYEVIGKQVIKIWEYFKLFEKGAYIDNDAILEDEARDYGTGKGYLRTLYILWVITIMVNAFIISIGVIEYLSSI